MPVLSTRAKLTLTEVWTGEATYASTLLVLFIDQYGTEGLSWHPETIQAEIEDDYKLILPQANFDRLLVAIQLVTSDAFYKSTPDFVNFCNILSGDTFDPTTWDPADCTEIAWGITEALLLSPPEDSDEEPFSLEICAYIGTALDQEGIINPPDVLKIATRDHDPTANVADFSDDAELYAGIYAAQDDKTEQINSAVRVALARLTVQLEGLPLRDGSTRNVVQKLIANLSQNERS